MENCGGFSKRIIQFLLAAEQVLCAENDFIIENDNSTLLDFLLIHLQNTQYSSQIKSSDHQPHFNSTCSCLQQNKQKK